MANFGYIRVSTQTQAEHGQGLDTQENEILKYCEKNSLEIEQIFTDEGISGTCAERDGLAELLATIDENDNVIVLNTSRLWRNDTVKVLVHHAVKKAKANIISIEQPTYNIYTTDPSEFLFNGMMELLDQYSRLEINMKLSKGRKTKARKGHKACGTAPFGYAWNNKEVIIDYNNRLIVMDIFEKYTEFGSVEKVRAYCDEMGYLTKAGNAFTKQSIANILHNDFYMGVVTHAGKKSVGTHQAIIDKTLFDGVQSVLCR